MGPWLGFTDLGSVNRDIEMFVCGDGDELDGGNWPHMHLFS